MKIYQAGLKHGCYCHLPWKYVCDYKKGIIENLPSILKVGQSLYQPFCFSYQQETTEAFHWSILYSSQDHGLSLNRFKHHVFAYRKPTILLLRCDDYLYAAAIDTEWRLVKKLSLIVLMMCYIYYMCSNIRMITWKVPWKMNMTSIFKYCICSNSCPCPYKHPPIVFLSYKSLYK